MTLTSRQRSNWLLFEDVRKDGTINMVNARAGSELTGMTQDEWMFTLKNYAKIQTSVEAHKADAEQQKS